MSFLAATESCPFAAQLLKCLLLIHCLQFISVLLFSATYIIASASTTHLEISPRGCLWPLQWKGQCPFFSQSLFSWISFHVWVCHWCTPLCERKLSRFPTSQFFLYTKWLMQWLAHRCLKSVSAFLSFFVVSPSFSVHFSVRFSD